MRIYSSTILLFLSLKLFAAEAVLSYDGIGPIKFGMKLQDVELLIKEKAITEQDFSPEGCNYVAFNTFKNVAFMIENNIVVRADAGENIKNSEGIKLGQTLKIIQEKFPEAKLKPNFYDNEAHDVYLLNPKGKGVILLEESKGKISSVRAGIEPAVSYVEGCL